MSLGHNSTDCLQTNQREIPQSEMPTICLVTLNCTTPIFFSLDVAAVLRLRDLLPVASVSLCFLPHQVEGRQRKPQRTAESFTSSIKLGYNNQPVSGQRLISQGAKEPFSHGLVTHSRAGWGIRRRTFS